MFTHFFKTEGAISPTEPTITTPLPSARKGNKNLPSRQNNGVIPPNKFLLQLALGILVYSGTVVFIFPGRNYVLKFFIRLVYQIEHSIQNYKFCHLYLVSFISNGLNERLVDSFQILTVDALRCLFFIDNFL